MNKKAFIDAFEKMISALEEVKDSLDTENAEDDDIFDQESVIEDMIFRMREKIRLLQGDSGNAFHKRIDFFPDWKENGSEMKKNDFFRYVNIMKLDFVDAKEVAEIKGWAYDEVLRRLEELPTPVYSSSMLHLWNRRDFGDYEHLHATLAQVVTVSEAAEIIGVSDRHVRRLCESKRIAARQSEDGTWLVGKRGAEQYRKGLTD